MEYIVTNQQMSTHRKPGDSIGKYIVVKCDPGNRPNAALLVLLAAWRSSR